MRELLQGICTGPYLKEILLNFHKVEFEKRKDLVQLFSSFVKLRVPAPNPLVDYILGFAAAYLDYVFAK